MTVHDTLIIGAGFTGLGAAIKLTEAGVDVVPGACPLMFLEPVGWFHRVHRAARRGRHALVVGSEPIR